MTFFQPLAFWSAVTIPLIILLYMLKKKTRPQTVSSIMLWQRLDRTSAPSLKINRLLRHLLLLLQILAACLLVLALAKPALPVVSGGAGSGSTIVIVDTSYSMLTVEDGESRFDLAINALQSMIGRKGSGEQIAIVSMAEQAQITSGLTADGSALLQAVENMNVTGGRANLQDALILAENLSHALEDASVVIISDGGSNESNIQIDMSLTFIPVGSEFVTNLLISDMIADGEGLYVTVHNNGTLPAGGTVQIKDSDGELIGQREVLLEPHQNAVLTWRQLADSPWYRGEIVAGDQLAWDDNFYAVSSGGENRRVLLVSEGNLFLERALMLQPGLAVTKARPSQFRPELSERYDYFVFDGYLPEDLPSAPLLVFDPPHPNPHFTTTIPFRPSRLQASAHPLTSYADFNEVTLSFAKAIGGGQPLLSTAEGNIGVQLEQQGFPLVVFGFAVQAGDLPLRPAFPMLMRNVFDSFTGLTFLPGRLSFGEPMLLDPPYQVDSLEVVAPSGNKQQVNGAFPYLGETVTETGIYTVSTGEQSYPVAVNVPAVTDSLATASTISAGGTPIPGSSHVPGKMPLAPILLLVALLLLGLEWWVDNRGY